MKKMTTAELLASLGLREDRPSLEIVAEALRAAPVCSASDIVAATGYSKKLVCDKLCELVNDGKAIRAKKTTGGKTPYYVWRGDD